MSAVHDKESIEVEVRKYFPTASEVVVSDITGTAGGLSSQIFRAVLGSNDPSTIIVKTTKNAESSATGGLVREADFYISLARIVDPDASFIPRCYFASSDAASGVKIMALEDLCSPKFEGVQSGYFFGSNSILNWGKDLAALTSKYPTVRERDVVLQSGVLAAKLHAAFWQDEALLSKPFLRAAGWVRGVAQDEPSFQGIAGWAVNAWKAFTKKQEAEPTVKIDPLVAAFVTRSIEQISYENYRKMWRVEASDMSSEESAIPWTLVHGDYHPANFILAHDKDGKLPFALYLVDWEAVGVGSGPQELGQYMISHSTAAERQANEEDLLKVYHETLNAELARLGKKCHISLDFVRKEYVVGGLARWAWLLPVCCQLCPPAGAQYFHDQVLHFLQDHNIDPSTSPMLRP